MIIWNYISFYFPDANIYCCIYEQVRFIYCLCIYCGYFLSNFWWLCLSCCSCFVHIFLFIELEIPTQFWFIWMLMILFDLFYAQFAWRQDKLWLYVSQWMCPQLYGIDWINFYFINSWEMSHHNDQYWNIRVVILRQCMLHCVASYLNIFTPHRLGCQRLKYILVFVSTTYQIIYVVSYRHRFPMGLWNHPLPKTPLY